jgi:nicotinate-nucleotide adenylyltransferase
VVFVPTGQALAEAGGVTPAEDRYLMTVIATASNPAFTVSRLEIDHPGPTYTVDTLRRLRAEQADGTLPVLHHRGRRRPPDPHLEGARPGARPGRVHRRHPARLRPRPPGQPGPGAAGRVHRMEIPALAISASDLRGRVARGAPIQYLVPDGVARYIHEHGLYRDLGPGTQ